MPLQEIPMTFKNHVKTPANTDTVGDHPIGGAIGAVIGAVDGAAFGTLAGLPGVATGIVIGGIAGALAGKAAAQLVNPNEEEKYWRDNHQNQSYFDSTTTYDSYAPAYRYGIEAYSTYSGRKFDEIEAQLAKEWDKARGTSRLTWDTARLAARDAYERLHNRNE